MCSHKTSRTISLCTMLMIWWLCTQLKKDSAFLQKWVGFKVWQVLSELIYTRVCFPTKWMLVTSNSVSTSMYCFSPPDDDYSSFPSFFLFFLSHPPLPDAAATTTKYYYCYIYADLVPTCTIRGLWKASGNLRGNSCRTLFWFCCVLLALSQLA